MSAATGTILTIAGIGAATGASLFGAKKASDAAKTASTQQQQSAQQALALQQQQYQQTRADLSPYRQQGQQGLTALSAYLGLPTQPSMATPLGGGGAGGASATGTARPNYIGQGTGDMGGAGGARPMPAGTIPLGQAVPRGPVPPTGGGTVLLRAPNGQTQAVPADQADYYVARGATRG